jgi:hypothetical protein
MSIIDAPDPLLQLKIAGEQPMSPKTEKQPIEKNSLSAVEGDVLDLSDLGTFNCSHYLNARYRITNIVLFNSRCRESLQQRTICKFEEENRSLSVTSDVAMLWHTANR